MKWTCLAFFLLTTPLVIAQNVTIEKDPETDLFTYQEVIPIENLSMQDGFDRSLYWISKNYKFLNEVLKVETADKKEIIFDSYFQTEWMLENGEVTHKLILEFKEGRIRITANQFSYITQETGIQSFDVTMILFKKSLIRYTEKQLEKQLRQLVNEISSDSTANDDW